MDFDLFTLALGFLFQPDITIAPATELPALDPDFGLPSVLTLIGSMCGSLRSDLRFSNPCQLDQIIHAAASLQIMVELVDRKRESRVRGW